MSYILDALKKSEKERKRGTVPDVLTIQETIPRETKKRSFWHYLIFATLLLNAIVLILWFGPWNSKKQKAVVHSTAENNVELKVKDLSDSESLKTQSSQVGISNQSETDKSKIIIDTKTTAKINNKKQDQLAQAKTDLQKKGMDKPVQKVETKSPDKVTPVIPKQDTVFAEVPTEKKPENYPAPVKNKIYSLSELPQSIQKSLPAFNISIFLYSDDPASRMVRVNGQTMKEGQYLANGLKLEEIISNELIFSFQDFRFRVGMK